jgi:hypothetical protein
MMTTEARYNLWRRELLENGYTETELPALPAEPEQDERLTPAACYYERRAEKSRTDGPAALICFGAVCLLVLVGVAVQWFQSVFLPVP